MNPTSTELPVVLVVDDTPDNLTVMSELLLGRYRVKIANGGEKALRIASGVPRPDLILLDVMMPGLDGYEVCRILRADQATKDIPVIFLTAKSEVEAEQTGLELGAVDYISKPISPPIVLARVHNHLQLKRMSDFLRDQNSFLESEVKRRTRDLRAIQDATIVAMASLAETRDNETGNHIRRTQHYVRELALSMRSRPGLGEFLTDGVIELLFKSAPLHDIGKVGIPDAILLKPGKLTPEEFELMKAHPTLGRDAIMAAERQMIDGESSFLRFAREIAYSHHEKWNGSGYPLGLAGAAIPISGRLMAIADVYDALICKRVYKQPFTHERAVEFIRAGRSSHFDPMMADCFIDLAPRFREIANEFADGDTD